MGYNLQESLENTIHTMSTLLGVHPIVPWQKGCHFQKEAGSSPNLPPSYRAYKLEGSFVSGSVSPPKVFLNKKKSQSEIYAHPWN